MYLFLIDLVHVYYMPVYDYIWYDKVSVYIVWWVISLTKFPPLLQKRWFTGILWNSYSEKITQNLKENTCAGLNEIEWRKTIKNKGGYSMLMLKSFALRDSWMSPKR